MNLEQFQETHVTKKDFSAEQKTEQGFSTEEVKGLFQNWQTLKEQAEELSQQQEQKYKSLYQEHGGKNDALVEELNDISSKRGDLQGQRVQLREKLKDTRDADGFPTPEAWIEIAADLEEEKKWLPAKIQEFKEERQNLDYRYEEFKRSRSQRKDLSPEAFQEYISQYEGELLDVNARISSFSQRLETVERRLKEGRSGTW